MTCVLLVYIILLCKFDRSDPGERNRFYFKGYWQKIKEKESLTPENVISAYYLLKKGEMHKLVSNTFASYEGEEDIDGFEDEILFHMSDYIAFIYTEEHNLSLCWNKKRKRSNRKTSGKKEKVNAQTCLKFIKNIISDYSFFNADETNYPVYSCCLVYA